MAVQASGARWTTQNVAATSHQLSIANTAGRALVAVVTVKTGPTQSVSSITDTAGNTWQFGVQSSVSGSTTRSEIWYTLNAAAATSLTVNLTSSLACSIDVSEYTGVVTASAFDASGAATASTNATQSSGTAATTQAGDLLVAGLSWATTRTVSDISAGWIRLAELAGSSTVQGIASAYQVAGAPGDYSATWTLSGTATACGAILALKAAAAGGGTTATLSGSTSAAPATTSGLLTYGSGMPGGTGQYGTAQYGTVQYGVAGSGTSTLSGSASAQAATTSGSLSATPPTNTLSGTAAASSASTTGTATFTAPPVAPTLSVGVSGSTVTWSWTQVGAETHYVVQIDTDNTFPNPTEVVIAAPTRQYVQNGVAAGTYYGRVKTRTVA